jgi:c-di-GMP-binding flagellar brake protein YcgR
MNIDKDLQDPTITHQLFQLITTMSDDERRSLLLLLSHGFLKKKRRRKHFRKPLMAQLYYIAGGKTCRAFTKDISLGGAFIMTQGRLSKGQELLIILPEFEDNKPVKIHSVISRITSVGVGIEFKAMSQEQMAALLAFASTPVKTTQRKV